MPCGALVRSGEQPCGFACLARSGLLLLVASVLLCACPSLANRDVSGTQTALLPEERTSLLLHEGGASSAAGTLAGTPAGNAGNGNLRHWASEESTSQECPSEGTFLEAISGPETGLRETLWSLLHQEMMGQDSVMALLDLEQSQAQSRARDLVSDWVLSMSGQCANPGICEDLAASMLRTDEGTCPAQYFLRKTERQLREAWSWQGAGRQNSLLESLLRHGNASYEELALGRWGLGLMARESMGSKSWAAGPTGKEADAATMAGRPANLKASSQLQSGAMGMALAHLDRLLESLAEPDADLLHEVRKFLRVVEKARSGPHLTATGSPDNLLGLLRLLNEQRSQASASSLIRDALLVHFHETQVRDLEDTWAALNPAKLGSASSSQSPAPAPSPPVQFQRVQLRGRAEQLLALLHRLAADHAAVLPGDAGALPAYWTGRVERVRRRLEGPEVAPQGSEAQGRADGGYRPTVLIWTCSFGGGHWAATKAVQAYLPDYTTLVSDPSRDKEFYEGDTVGNWIRRFITPEWDRTYVFNQFVLRDKFYHFWSIADKLQDLRGWFRGDGTHFAPPCAPPTCDTEEKKLMRRALLRNAPDFVITVYHMDLLQIAELCDELGGLPLMHLSTDADVKMRQVFGSRPLYPNLRVGLTFDVPEVWDTIRPLTRDQLFVSGYSVRTPFLQSLPSEKMRAQEKSRRGIPAEAQVLLVMSGSQGQSVEWPRRLADSETWEQPLHVIVVAARNQEFGSRLEGLLQPLSGTGPPRFRGYNANVTLEVARDPHAGRTVGGADASYLSEEEIASLMDVADVLLTKPGGSTAAEAAYRGVPVVFDATGGALPWEDFNARVFETHGRGIRMTSASELEPSIQRAAKLGRSQSLASVAGKPIDARKQIRDQMQRMLTAFHGRWQQQTQAVTG